MGAEFLFGVLERVDKRWGSRAVVLLVVGAVAGAVVGLSTFGFVVYQFAKWQAHELLTSANQRADAAEALSVDANKRASELSTELQQLKAKYDTQNGQLQIYQKAEEIRKKNAALPKQTAKRPRTPILSDLFGEDEYFIIGHHHRRLIMDRRYTILATPGGLASGGLLGSSVGCTLTVANVDTNEEGQFEFFEGKSGVLSVGETKVVLILMSAIAVGSRSNVCVFAPRRDL